jgi:hypothetical protein
MTQARRRRCARASVILMVLVPAFQDPIVGDVSKLANEAATSGPSSVFERDARWHPPVSEVNRPGASQTSR